MRLALVADICDRPRDSLTRILRTREVSPPRVWTPSVLAVTSITNQPGTHLFPMYTSTL